MECLVISKCANGDYRVYDKENNRLIFVDLFVDASCSFNEKEELIGKVIIIEELTAYAYFAKNVKLKDTSSSSLNK